MVGANNTAGYLGDTAAANAAELNSPAGIALDSAHTLYISDELNERIRIVANSTQIITTVAGNGTAGYSGDGSQATSAEINSPVGIVVDPSGNIYIGGSVSGGVIGAGLFVGSGVEPHVPDPFQLDLLVTIDAMLVSQAQVAEVTSGRIACWNSPEVLRTWGEKLLAAGEPADMARPFFEQALTRAQAQGAAAWRDRAAASLTKAR